MKTAALIVNIVFILLFIPICVIALITFIASQAPNSEVSNSFWLSSAPFVIIIAQIISWIFFANGNYKIALWTALIPIVNIIFIVMIILKDWTYENSIYYYQYYFHITASPSSRSSHDVYHDV